MNKATWLIAAILGCALCGCAKGGETAAGKASETEHAEEGHSEDITLTAEAIQIAGIQTEVARTMPIQGQLQVPGVVTNTALGKAVVTAPTAGKIVRIFAGPGDRVTTGQAIATLQSADLAAASAGVTAAQREVITAEAGVHEAKSQMELALSKLGTARATLSRQQEFARTGAFSQPSLQQAQRDLNEAEAELESAIHEHPLHQAQLERAERLYRQELISRTDLEQARLEVQRDKIRMETAKRQMDLAKATLERERKIAERGLMNSREIQAAEAEVRNATSELQQSRIKHRAAIAGVAGARKGLEAARGAYSAQAGGSRASGGTVTVVAPIGGVLTHREVSLGQAVERTTEICEIENLRSVWVTASVPEKDISKAVRGASAQVTVKSFPGRTYYGVVQVVGSRLDSRTRTMPVQVLVDNRDATLRTDMFATVALGVGGNGSALTVKRSAIVEDGDKRMLYVAEEGGKFEERTVELGRVQGEHVEILNGLEAGSKVVVKGAFILKSEKVKSELKGHDH